MANAKHDQNRIPTLIGVSSTDGVSPTLVYVDPTTHRLYVDLAGGGGGFTLLTATGNIDGSNTAFTFAQLPTYIISDHAWYTATNVGPTGSPTINWSWNAGTLTATMQVAPTEDIFGFV